MAKVTNEEALLLQRKQEARNFVGKNGPEYVQNLATEKERKYFEGILYYGGIPILALLSYMSSPNSLY